MPVSTARHAEAALPLPPEYCEAYGPDFSNPKYSSITGPQPSQNQQSVRPIKHGELNSDQVGEWFICVCVCWSSYKVLKLDIYLMSWTTWRIAFVAFWLEWALISVYSFQGYNGSPKKYIATQGKDRFTSKVYTLLDCSFTLHEEWMIYWEIAYGRSFYVLGMLQMGSDAGTAQRPQPFGQHSPYGVSPRTHLIFFRTQSRRRNSHKTMTLALILFQPFKRPKFQNFPGEHALGLLFSLRILTRSSLARST